jgi:hypothetical protein
MSMTVAFYKGTRAENPQARLFDRLVCWWPRSRGRFSHAELVGHRIGTIGICWSASMRDGSCVREKNIDLASGRWVLVLVPYLDTAPAVTWFEGARGRAYDYPGILGYVMPGIKQLRRWLYCSEAVAEAITAAARVCNLPAEWPADPNLSPNALYAWCAAQPGARVIELPYLERGHA